MTLTAVYNFVSDHNIPRKKVKGKSYYSTKHVEAAKGVLDKTAPSYYTVREAMEKFGLTRDQLYQYTKRYNVPKLKQGRKSLFLSKNWTKSSNLPASLDKLFVGGIGHPLITLFFCNWKSRGRGNVFSDWSFTWINETMYRA